MDDNTKEVLTLLIAGLFGIGAFWAVAWAAVNSARHDESIRLPEQPMYTYKRNWRDDDFDDEAKGGEA